MFLAELEQSVFQCPGLIQSRCYLRYGLCCVTQGWARFRGTHTRLCLEELCEQRQNELHCEKPPVSVEGTEVSLLSGRCYERVWQEHEAQAEAMGFIFTRQRQIRLPPRRGEEVYYCDGASVSRRTEAVWMNFCSRCVCRWRADYQTEFMMSQGHYPLITYPLNILTLTLLKK